MLKNKIFIATTSFATFSLEPLEIIERAGYDIKYNKNNNLSYMDRKYLQKGFITENIYTNTELMILLKDIDYLIVHWTMLDRNMIETDAPYLAPVPNRGKRNEPAMVKYIAEKISNIKKIPIEEVASITTKTAQQFLGI